MITRFEVIDESGRLLVRYPARVELSYQDDGRTLKVFLSGLNAEARAQHWRAMEEYIALMFPASRASDA